MSQLPQEPRSQQSIEGSSIAKSQIAQADRDVHQTFQEIHHHWGDRTTQQSVRQGTEKILLQQVKSEIDERLSTSLHSATFINLGKEKQNSQVQRNWDAEVKVGQQQRVAVEPGTSIVDVFDQSNIAGKLLILGAPGSGKTTTLLELAEILVQRATISQDNPIPVLLNLSSWKNNQSFDQWFIQENKSKYGVREEITQQWLENYQLLPLLDGLDELETRWHEVCIHSINGFYEQYRPSHLVVCCRLSEYQDSQTKLHLNAAIYLKPLSEMQIQEYLMSAERPELWQSIEADPGLMKLARSPLLLSILTLARQEISFEEWRSLSTRKEQRHYLVSAYVERMLNRSISDRWYPRGHAPSPEQTRRWLSKVAKHLIANARSEFLIEQIQPDWLVTPKQHLLYRAGTGLLLGTLFGTVLGFGTRVYEAIAAYVSEDLSRLLVAGFFSGIANSIWAGVVWGIAGLLIFGLSNRLYKVFIYAPIIGILASIPTETGGLQEILSGGLIAGVVFSFFMFDTLRRPIRPLETMSWSIAKAKSGAIYGFISVAICFVIYAPFAQGVDFRPDLFLPLLLIGFSLGGLLSRFSHSFNLAQVGQVLLKRIFRGGRYGLIGGLIIALLWNIFFVFQAISYPDIINTDPIFKGASFSWNLLILVVGYEIIGGLLGMIAGGLILSIINVSRGIWKYLRQSVIDTNKSQWSLPRVLKGSLWGGLGSLILGILIFSTTFGTDPIERILMGFWMISVMGLFGSLIGAVIGGFRGPEIEIRMFPNQGMWKSTINAGLIATLAAGLIATILILWGQFFGELLYGVHYGLSFSLGIGLFGGLALSGATFRHIGLRFALYCSALAPWNYARFLNYASERMLVRRIGGRYQFIHDAFRQYFASL